MRLDKFLKVTRIIKRRTIAKELADNGNIQINNDVHLVHIRLCFDCSASGRPYTDLTIKIYSHLFNKVPGVSLRRQVPCLSREVLK